MDRREDGPVFSPGRSLIFGYRNVDECEKIDDRLTVPLDALELAAQGGWKMADFVSNLKGENGEQAKAVADSYLSTRGFLLTPNFWFCLGRALGCAGSLPVVFNGVERSYPREGRVGTLDPYA